MGLSRVEVLALGLLLLWSCATMAAARPMNKQHPMNGTAGQHHRGHAHRGHHANHRNRNHTHNSTLGVNASSFARHLAQEEPQATPGQDDFMLAPSCRTLPTAASSAPDQVGRLWGWRNNMSCAFKDVANHVLFYVDYTPGDWLNTPPCTMPAFPDTSVADSKFKVWGWEAEGSLCAFKTDVQQPIPIQKHYTRLSWVDASTCTSEPLPTANNSAPDKNGCLWGWQLDRNCVFRNPANSSEPAYYLGYTQTCNITASVEQAAEFNAKADSSGDFGAAEQDGTYDMPAAVTAVGRIGQKKTQPYYTASEIDDKFSNADAPLSAAELPENSDAPFVEATVPVDFGPSDSPSPVSKSRQLLQTEVVDPRFPKLTIVVADRPADWTDGGPGSLSPPRHGSRSVSFNTPLLPETVLKPELSAAEGDRVTYAAVPQGNIAEPTHEIGPGGISPPGTSGSKGASVRLGEVSTFKSAEVATAQVDGQLLVGLSHANDAMMPQAYRRRLSATAFAVATAVATADASGSSGGHSAATSVASAVSSGNSTAVAVGNAHANSTGNGTSVSVANPTAVATDGHNAESVVDSATVAHQTNASCILAVSTLNGKVYWSCGSGRPAAGAAADPVAAALQGNKTAPQPDMTNQPSNMDSLASTWQGAPVCGKAPNKTNSVQDAMGRLWGYENDRPCAYRAADGTSLYYADYIQVKWDTAPACTSTPSSSNSMADAQGRLWGWDSVEQENCAYKRADSGQPIYYQSYSQQPAAQPGAPGATMLPSAAGPSNNSIVGDTTSPVTSPPPASAQQEAAVAQEADSQAQAIVNSLSQNATVSDVALASARQAVIYQTASEATSPATSSIVQAAEGPTTQPNEAVQLLTDVLRAKLGKH